MKKLSLQWRITLMTALLICSTCMAMNWLIGCSGRHYMDSIGANLSTAIDPSEGAVEYFDPSREGLDPNLTIVIYGAQTSFTATNWYITAAVTLLGGILAYFVSGRALRPLRTFVAQVEKVQPDNLADMKITEEVLPEFRQFSDSFNQMLERLDEGFTAQRQFTGNAAHELRTPLALMQAQVELFSAEHPDVLPETADFLRLLREQTERMTQMTRTLLEMCGLQAVPCTDHIELGPMIDEIFADLAPLAEKNNVMLEREGDGTMNKTELLDKYARDGESRLLLARVLDQQQRADQRDRDAPEHCGRGCTVQLGGLIQPGIHTHDGSHQNDGRIAEPHQEVHQPNQTARCPDIGKPAHRLGHDAELEQDRVDRPCLRV